MTRADLGVKGAGIGKTRGAGPMNRKATIPALAALRRWWPGSHQWPGSRRMAAVPGTAAGVRALSPRRRDRSAMTARNGVAPHRRLARAAWVLLALAGLAPAQAQVEDYISNVISTGTGNSNTEITISQSFAQTFRTGSQSGGYPLQEVVLRLDGLDTGTGAIRVTIRENSVVDGNNVPGMTRYTLTNPASLSSSNSGRNTFTAPSGATLVANTLYHVVAESTSGTAARWQRTTRRTMSVRPFGTDWDIGFDYLRQRADPPSWEVAASGRAFMVAVRGGDDGGGGNAAPTGVPTISDTTPMVGDTLTADASGISDPDGPASLTFTWRWLRVSGSTETPISGATSPTYTVVAADVGAKLKVEASFTDASGTAETVESAETDTVGEAPLPTVSVERVSSLVEEGAGAQFTVTRTVVTTGALTVRYDVSESGAMVASGEEGAKTLDFSGNTTSLTVTVPTVEDSVHEADSTVTVTLTADAAYDLGADTTATVTVEDDDNAAPTGMPTISDEMPMVGDTLTADASGVSDPDGLASPTFTWRWIRVSGGTDTPISGATSATYTVADADAGARLKVEASFTDEDGTAETVESVPTMTVPTPPPPPASLVSNTDKPDHSSTNVFNEAAQPFTTGNAPGGYDLSSVVLKIASPGSGYEVTIRESVGSGNPGGTVHTLTSPPTDLGGGLHEYQAPAGATLEAGTDYHIVAERMSGTRKLWSFADSVGAGAGSAPGWTLGRFLSRSGSNWLSAGLSFKVQIRGTEASTNTPATGKPTISDTAPKVGDTLTADGSGISDADGPASPAFTWQWIRVSGGTDTRIAGATSASYTVVAADLGATLKVEASFTDDGGTDEAVQSAETAAVGEALPTVTVTPVTTPVTEGTDAVFRLARTGDTAARLPLRLSISETGDMVQDSREGEDLPASIPIGSAWTNLFVPTDDDSAHEADSVVTVTLAANAAYELGTDTTAEVTVEDNDNAPPTGTVTIDDTTPMVGETLTADASGVSDPDGPASLTFTWQWVRVSGGTATPIPGATAATYTVVAADAGATLKAQASFTDDDGTDETVESAATDPVGGAPLPALSIGDASAAEGDSGSATLDFTVTLDSAATATVTVEWATSDGTATAGTDYTAGSGTLTFGAGDSSRTVSVTVLGDEVDEPDETFTVTLTNPSGATLGDATATGTITNDDDDPTVTLVLTPDTITEDGGASALSATLDHASGRDTVVTVSVSPVGPATASDYSLSPNVETLDLMIPAGDTESDGTVTITAVDNAVHAPDKTVTVSATAANDAGVTNPQDVTLTITDDDNADPTGAPTIDDTTPMVGETLMADASGVSDPDGPASLTFTWRWIRVSGGTDTPIPGATAASYTVVDADVGSTLKVEASFTDDGGTSETVESAATATVEAASLPTVTVAPVSSPVVESEDAQFTVTRTGVTTGALTVRYNVVETGTMVRSGDKGAQTVDFSGDTASVTVTVPTVFDNLHERNSRVTVTLTADAAYELGTDATARVLVKDDDDSPATGTVTVTGTAREGETLTADTSGIADEDGGLDTAAYVYQWVRTPSGGSDADISGATSRTYVPVYADAGATLKVRVTVTDDEGHEASFTSAPTSAVAALPRPSVTVVSDGDVTEGSAAVFTLTRTGATTGTLDVAYEVTATGSFGAATGAGTATFPANSATVQVTVATTGDGAHEAHGSVTVTLTADTSAAPAYLLGAPSAATAAVRDDDNVAPTGVPTIDDTTPVVGQTLTAEASGIADADGLTGATFTWRWLRVSGGTETEVGTGATYLVVAGDVGATLKVEASFTDDGRTAETVESAATSAVEAATRPRVSVARVASPVAEGEDAQLRVTRTGVTTGTLTVRYDVSESGAMVASGEEGAKTVAFADGDTERTVTVPTVEDNAHEADSVVTLTLTADAAYDLGTDTATVTVEDDDNAAPTGAPTIDDTTPVVGETLTASPSGIGDPDGLTSPTYAWRWLRVASGGGETEVGTGTTYTVVAADVGSTLKVEAAFTDDDGTSETVESAETATVEAAPVPTVSVARVASPVAEGAGAQFTVTRTGVTTGALTVNYSVSESGAMVASGEEGAQTVDFSGNAARVTVTVPTVEDSAHEADSTVTLTLTADAAYDLGTDATATVTIEDNDNAAPTGAPTIDDTTPVVGETLTASPSGIGDPDGLTSPTYAWRWLRVASGGGETQVGTGTSYTVVAGDVGSTLKVEASFTDDDGTSETVESVETATVAAVSLPTVTVAPRKSPVSEGDPAAEFVLTRTGDTTGALRVRLSVSETGEMVSAGNEGGQHRTIPAGHSSVVISVPTVDDGVHEADSVVTVTLEANAAYELGSDATAEVTVEDDDDLPVVTVAPRKSPVSEGDPAAEFVLTRTGDTTGALRVRLGVSETGEMVSAGNEGGNKFRTLPAGQSSAVIPVPTVDDDVHEADSVVTVTLEANAAYELGSDATAEVTVEDDDDLPVVTVAPVSSPVVESEDAQFTVTRTGVTTGALTVRYNVVETGTMVRSGDKGAQTVDFSGDTASVTVTVPTVFDNLHERNSRVTVTLTADAAYELGTDATARVLVKDDDDSPATGTVTVTGTAREGETLTADTSGIADEDGGLDTAAYVYQWVRTPSGGSDADISGATSRTYVPVYADAGATLKVRVTVTDDEGHEASFTSAPTSAVAALPRPSVTVVSDGDVTEGSAAVFTLTRTGATTGTLDVAYEVTATGSFGAATGAGTATFPANSATVQVTVATTGDGAHEAHGSVTVTLTADTSAAPAYLLGAPSAATAAVEDDDDSPTTGAVTVTGTPTEGQTLTADTSGLADADGLANAAYAWQWVRTPSGGDADISGATSQTYVPVFADAGATLKVKVTVTDDEGHEATFTSAPTSAVAALPRPEVTVASDSDVTEGSAAVFTLTRTGATTGTLDVAYEVTVSGDFGVTPGTDTAMFEAGSSTVQVSLTTTDDSTHEAHGSVTLTLTADTSADPAYLLGDPSTATATVRDDDDSPTTGSVTVTGTATEGETLTADTSAIADEDGLDNADYAWQWVRTPAGGSDEDISGATSDTYVAVFADMGATLKVKVTVTDDEGHEASFTSAPTSAVAALPRPSVTVVSAGDVTEGSAAEFTLTRTGATTGTLDVTYDVTVSGDFGVTPGTDTAMFEAGSSTVQVSLTTTDDSTHEAHGSVTLTLTADTSADPAYLLGDPSTATATVRDDDDSPTTGSVTVTGTATEGETLTADTSGLTDADGLASAAYVYQWVRTPSGGSDADISGATSDTYVAVFADMGATLKVKVTVTDDEGHEATFTSAPTSAVAALPRPEVTVASAGDVTEGNPALFTLTRTGATTGTLDVTYDVTVSGDFGVTPGTDTAMFEAGSSTVQVSLTTTGDSTHEAHGSVTLTLTADTGADPAYLLGDPSTATATVRDDDDSPASGAVTVTGTATEGETLSADTSGLTDADGLASAAYVYQWVRTPSGGSDADISGATSDTYVAVFADMGATLKVKVTVTDDEGHEASFTSAPTSAVVAASRPSVTVASDGDVTEGSPAVFTLTRTGATAGTLDVAYTVTAIGDFGAATGPGTASFTANSATVQVSLTTTDDSTHEAHGSVTVTLTADTGADPAYLLGDPATATATVRDNDNADPTGAPTIDDTTPVVGQTLTVNPSGIGDPDGLTGATFTYQWFRESGGTETPIAGATEASYKVVADDVGATLKVVVSFTDDEGHGATFEITVAVAVLSIGDKSVHEGASGDSPTLEFTVELDSAAMEPVTVDWATSGGTATAEQDYTEVVNGTLRFNTEEKRKTITVSVTGDNVDEPDETFTVTLSNQSSGATIAKATGTIINDDDDPKVTLVLSPDTIDENGGTSTVTARLDHPSSEETTVTVSVAPVLPAEEGDYKLSENRALTIEAGGTTSTGEVTITAEDNDVVAPDKTVTVSGTATNAQGIKQPQNVTLTLRDDDLPDGRRRRLEYALASFGRTVAQDLVTAVEDRRWATGTTATLAGTRLHLSEEAVYETLRRHTDPDGDLMVDTAALREMLSRSSFQVLFFTFRRGTPTGMGRTIP